MMNPLNFENENYITIRAKGGTSTRRASTSRYVLEGVTGTHVKCNGLIVRLVSMGPYEIPGKYEFEDYVTCALEAYIFHAEGYDILRTMGISLQCLYPI